MKIKLDFFGSVIQKLKNRAILKVFNEFKNKIKS